MAALHTMSKQKMSAQAVSALVFKPGDCMAVPEFRGMHGTNTVKIKATDDAGQDLEVSMSIVDLADIDRFELVVKSFERELGGCSKAVRVIPDHNTRKLMRDTDREPAVLSAVSERSDDYLEYSASGQVLLNDSGNVHHGPYIRHHCSMNEWVDSWLTKGRRLIPIAYCHHNAQRAPITFTPEQMRLLFPPRI